VNSGFHLLVSIAFAAAVAAAAAASTQDDVVGYYRFPTIHGDTVVFSAEGDLWKVPAEGGQAMRLTTHEGSESFAKFSPDGRWIAFSGEYQGNVDVYVMPATGGEPRRLTFHPGLDQPVAWRPDGGSIVFRSMRISPNPIFRLFEVPVGGGHPTLVEIGAGALASFSPDGRRIAFNRISFEFSTWKRYRGGTAQDIWLGDLETGTFEKITDWPGTDRFPVWYGGRIYFLSDRKGRLNIFSAEPDIEVDILPEDYIAGRDPQLDRAIAELQRLLEEQPIKRPVPPPLPDKSPEGGK